MLDGLMLLGGGVLLYFGAEWLVAGSTGLARSWGVSALLVGLTVVAYGTSAPEVVVGIQAAIAGHPDIALGNVLGSNIANLGLILGATALVRPTPVHGSLARREVPMLVLSALLVPLLLLDGRVQAYEGAALVLGAIAYTAWTVRTSRRSLAEVEEAAATAAEAARRAGGPTVRSRPLLAVIALAGLCGLFVGGKLFVEGAAGLAHMLGMSERLIGLTIIAVGTSVPELATSLIAAWRGHCDIAVGNVVGSNVFNILLCLGTAAIAGSVGAPLSAVAVDVSVMVGFTLFGAFLMRGERTIRRLEGAGLLVSYASFLVALAVL